MIRKRTTRAPSVPSMPTTETRQPNKTKVSPLTLAVLVIVLIAALGLTIKKGLDGRFDKSDKTSAGKVMAPDDVKALIAKVGSLIVIKSDENPTVATIQDAELLRTQNPTFYKDAQNGDRLLLWSDKAVLYSTSRNIILAVMPISVPASTAATSTVSTTTPSSTKADEKAVIEVRNGSGITGLGRTMATKLKAAGLSVLAATDAKEKNYAKTVIVKATDKDLPETLKLLVLTTGAEVVAAPTAEGEIKGDFLVIVGADYQ